MIATEALGCLGHQQSNNNETKFNPNHGEEQANSLGSDCSSSDNSSLISNASQQQQRQQESTSGVKCSAVHTLEREMPNYDYTHLIQELRRLILADVNENVGMYANEDIEKCRNDDWHLARFLLRNKLQLADSLDMLRKAMRFNNESLTNSLGPQDFPAEFYQLSGVFDYEPDRKGNRMLYFRVALHRKTPEILSFIQAFIYHKIKQLDEQAQGKGISIVIDCTGAGLANADMDILLFIISTLKNYFPKGLSYFLINELPWILKPFWYMAKALIPEEHRQLIKFSDSKTIYEFVDKQNLPDFLGGTCARDYRRVPDNCTRFEEAAKLWGVDHFTLRKVIEKFEQNLPPETVARIYAYLEEREQAKLDNEQITTNANDEAD